MSNLRIVLHQIYVGLFVEYGGFCTCFFGEKMVSDIRLTLLTLWLVVKNPLSPAEHPGGIGVDCESFELGLDQFIVCESYPVIVGSLDMLTLGTEWHTAGVKL